MTVFVIRNGQLVEKQIGPRRPGGPYLSRMEPFESPVTGKQITSWRERDADMKAADAIDPRDMPPPPRGRQAQEQTNGTRQPDAPFEWRDPD